MSTKLDLDVIGPEAEAVKTIDALMLENVPAARICDRFALLRKAWDEPIDALVKEARGQ